MKKSAVHPVPTGEIKKLSITSSAFAEGEMIPTRYTCEGMNINPPLQIGSLPEGTLYLALMVSDPDAPKGTWLHWLVWNIPATTEIRENSVPGTEGINDFRQHHYGGPCPPSGTHRYYFKVYALQGELDLPANASREQFEKAVKDLTIGFGELMGVYKKKNA
jgi:Raf kinase inhibitor-like YbhB/YbcL family protein